MLCLLPLGPVSHRIVNRTHLSPNQLVNSNVNDIVSSADYELFSALKYSGAEQDKEAFKRAREMMAQMGKH